MHEVRYREVILCVQMVVMISEFFLYSYEQNYAYDDDDEEEQEDEQEEEIQSLSSE